MMDKYNRMKAFLPRMGFKTCRHEPLKYLMTVNSQNWMKFKKLIIQKKNMKNNSKQSLHFN